MPPRNYFYPRLSPDGTRIAVDAHDQEKDIWIWDIVRGTFTRLIGSGEEFYPIWTPDGRRIVYGSVDGSKNSLLWRLADGTGAEERLTKETDYTQRRKPFRRTASSSQFSSPNPGEATI